MMDAFTKIRISIEVLIHIVALLLGVGLLYLLASEANSFSKMGEKFYTAALSTQAGYIGILVCYMIFNMVKSLQFIVSNNRDTAIMSTELVVLMLCIITFGTILMILKMTLFKNLDAIDDAAVVLVGPKSTMQYVMEPAFSSKGDTRNQTDFIKTRDAQGDKGAFSFNTWIGLDSTTLSDVYGALQKSYASAVDPNLMHEDGKLYRVKIPLFIRGIPKLWYVQSGLNPELKNDSNAVALVKCPIIWLVIGIDISESAIQPPPIPPYFEIEFNHMEDIHNDPLTHVPNSCYVQNTFTAKCEMFKNSLEMDVRDQLKKGSRYDKNALHMLTFVFEEQYVHTSISSLKQDLHTKMTVYVDGLTTVRENLFKGQLRLSSSNVKVLPQELLETQLNNSEVNDKVRVFLANSDIAGAVYYSYPLERSSIAHKYSAGYNTYPNEAVISAEPEDVQGNNDRSLVTLYGRV